MRLVSMCVKYSCSPSQTGPSVILDGFISSSNFHGIFVLSFCSAFDWRPFVLSLSKDEREGLRTGPSTCSGRALRHAQDRPDFGYATGLPRSRPERRGKQV